VLVNKQRIITDGLVHGEKKQIIITAAAHFLIAKLDY